MSVQLATQSSKRLGATLGTGRNLRRRLLLHHLPLALASVVMLVLFMGLSPFASSGGAHGGMGSSSGPFFSLSFEPGSRASMSQLTVATGYVATVLLALTLLIGPANLLLRRRTPVSSYLARDVGIWAAMASVVHVIVGLHPERVRSDVLSFVDYFFADGRPLTNAFGWGNWTGLAATVIVIALLATSTDGSLRELKARRWKDIQRLNYALFVLVIAHAVFYGAREGFEQWVEQLTSPFGLVLLVTVIAVFLGQAIGIWLYRRRHARTPASQRDPRQVRRRRQSTGATG